MPAWRSSHGCPRRELLQQCRSLASGGPALDQTSQWAQDAQGPLHSSLRTPAMHPRLPLQGPAVTMVRRHARGGDGSQHYGPALQVGGQLWSRQRAAGMRAWATHHISHALLRPAATVAAAPPHPCCGGACRSWPGRQHSAHALSLWFSAPSTHPPTPALLQTVSGNYVAAKRKGVVGGVDYQLTGVVRFVQVRLGPAWAGPCGMGLGAEGRAPGSGTPAGAALAGSILRVLPRHL